MRKPNLNALRMFDAAARHLNFRLAAAELHLTQGAVAQQVRRLESDLGFTLFERKARGLALTEVGRRYHGPIRRALALIDDATETLKPRTELVTLSVTPSFASKWLVPRLGRLSRDHPQIALQTVASETLADFTSDGVNIAIRQGNAPPRKGLHSELLAPLELCAVKARDCTVGAVCEDISDFRARRLVQDSHRYWERLFEEAGLIPEHRILQFNQTALAMDAATNGQGIALAPRILVEDDVTDGKLEVVWRCATDDIGGFYLVYPERRRSAATDTVIEWIRVEIPM